MAQIEPAAEAMINKLTKYFCILLLKTPIICSTILDPQFKLHSFSTNKATLQFLGTSSKELQEQFENEAQKHFTNAENVPSSTQVDMSPSGIYDELYESSTPDQSSLENELNRLLVETSEPKSTDVLVFWQTQRHLFPTLGKMAQKFLSIPATSAPSERIFSIGRKILTFQQACLSPMHVEQLACIKDWACTFGHLYSETDKI
ncbi:hypothetical protein O181_041721 [Austropuccinia psidii MF-1]|uniref:HAT C-terminal dimerisation domain-containing protein n=1 Tax=Austropuccinia psidii MF-1 TaxID=1389203 RepID=A0A9Q3DDJ3_9BASI|nr:hypothetical protein [Austropuccinia psidii MF-1]